MNRHAVLLALLSAALFGLSTPAAKLLLGAIDPTVLAGLLYCGAGLGVAILRRIRRFALVEARPSEVALSRRDVPYLAGAIVAGGVVGPVLLMAGLLRTDASAASLLLTLEGVATALMAWFMFHENFDRRIALGMACLIGGAMVLSWTGQPHLSDLLDPTNPLSARFNPLLEVRKGFNEVRDVHNITDILIDPEGARAWRDHWEKSAHSLLTGTILHVLYAEEEKTLARVASFLSDPARSIRRTMWLMLTTNHLGTDDKPRVHPAVAQSAREILNKTDNERSGVVSTAMTLLGLYRDPIIARMTSGSDWRIPDLLGAERPVSLYLGVPPSDISRTRPLVRLILNQIGRRLTERYDANHADPNARQLLFMLDEFPALGRLDFFESALAYLAAYRVRAFLVAQSLHQIDKAYGHNHSILDNCHVRVAFTPNDERTAKRLSDTFGTSTQLRAQRNLSGRRLSAWLSHMTVSEQETPRPLLTPGEILQLPAGDALVMVSGRPPIRAGKLRYYADHNFLARRLAAPALVPDRYHDAPPARADDWSGTRSTVHPKLHKAWSELVTAEEDPPRTRERVRERARSKTQSDKHSDLPLFAEHGPEPERDMAHDDGPPLGDDNVIDFPGARF